MGEFLYKATMALATSMSALPILVVHKPPRVRGFIDREIISIKPLPIKRHHELGLVRCEAGCLISTGCVGRLSVRIS